MSQQAANFEWRTVVGHFDDIRELAFWKTLAAEAIGTFLLVFVACGSCVASSEPGGSILQIALCFGLAVATVVWGISHVSGGHINPAVTIAFMITRRISIVKALLYIVAQTGGATFGAWILHLCLNNSPKLGVTLPSNSIGSAQAFGIEALITFVLVFTVFATCDSGREDLEGSGPLAIGLSVTLCHLFAVPFTGSSMNPARSFGPAAVLGVWDRQWIYWVSPITGGAAAALLYEHFFAVGASLKGLERAFLSKSPVPVHHSASHGLEELEEAEEHSKLASVSDVVRYHEDSQHPHHHQHYRQADGIRGHQVGKLPTPRWYMGRQNSIGVGLEPTASQMCLVLAHKTELSNARSHRDIRNMSNTRLNDTANHVDPKRDSVTSLTSRNAESKP